MKAINFPQVNVRFAENQEQYETLPAFKNEYGLVIACFELDEQELKQIRETGKIYLRVLTHNSPLQPIVNTILNPFPDKGSKSPKVKCFYKTHNDDILKFGTCGVCDSSELRGIQSSTENPETNKDNKAREEPNS